MKKPELMHDCFKTGPLWETEEAPEAPEGRNHLDQYFTPPECTHAFVNWLRGCKPNAEHQPFWATFATWFDLLESPGVRVLEPCAGENYIADVLRDRFPEIDVQTADLDPKMPVNRPGIDALTLAPEYIQGFQFVISNPPFNVAPDILRRMIANCDRVAMYLRLSFLERCTDKRSRRDDLLDKLAAVVVLPRHGFIKGKKGNDSLPCGWFLFDSGVEPQRRIEYVTKAQFTRIQDELAGQSSLFPVKP